MRTWSLDQLFTSIQDVFFGVNEWVREMQETVIRSKSLQDLLTLSEKVIGNTINISDSALTLLAHTFGITADDPVTQALIDNGFHPEATLRMFKDAAALRCGTPPGASLSMKSLISAAIPW